MTSLDITSISYQSWSTSAQSELLNAVTDFPMDSYVKELASHSTIHCIETRFLIEFFKLLFILVRNLFFSFGLGYQTKSFKSQQQEQIFTPLYHRHLRDFCNSNLLELQHGYKDHYGMNLIFTKGYLETSIGSRYWRFDCFSSVIEDLRFFTDNQTIANTFQLLLNKTDEALIISKAAMHCLQYLCDPSFTKKQAKRHLRIREIERKNRVTRPWKWHRRALCRDLARKHVLIVRKYWDLNDQRLTLTTYGRLHAKDYIQHYPIYSLHSQRWIHWRSNGYDGTYTTQIFNEYLSLLKYFTIILPRAGSFLPLIQLCKTKCFGPMSMMFPDESLRGRHAIEAYINRMDTAVLDNELK